MRIGVLTGGGDCPGLNAVIRAVVRKGITEYGHEFVGFRDGWRGPLDDLTRPLGIAEVRGILPRGGTILGSSRTNPFKIEDGVEKITANLAAQGVEALVAIGGEDTLGVASEAARPGREGGRGAQDHRQRPGATDYTFGFDTAVNIAMEAIDRLHTTAESHHRTLVVEVMGRHAGWIALHAGLAGGANVILLPERPFDVDQVAAYVEKRFQTQYAPIVVVAEGAQPVEGQMIAAEPGAGRVRPRPARRHRPVARRAARGEAPARRRAPSSSGTSSAAVRPTAFDRVLATRFGLNAIDAVHEGDWGKMVALRGTDIVRVPLAEATARAQDRPAGAVPGGGGASSAA